MQTNHIDTPQKLGSTLKKVFAKLGIEISNRYIKTVRGLEGSYYEISTFRSKAVIPNDIRKQLLELAYGKPLEQTGVQTPDDINYGNILSQRIAVFGRDWKKWLESQPEL